MKDLGTKVVTDDKNESIDIKNNSHTEISIENNSDISKCNISSEKIFILDGNTTCMESIDDDKDNNECTGYDDTIGSDGTTTVEHDDDEDIQ